MKFTMEVDSAENPDAVGEYLRSVFFAEDKTDDCSMGCYNVFDWAEGVEPLDEIYQPEVICLSCQETVESSTEEKLEDMFGPQGPAHFHPSETYCSCIDEARWTRGRKRFGPHLGDGEAESTWIECRYWWDGDGTLVFCLPDDTFLYNTDCKKNYAWALTHDPEDF